VRAAADAALADAETDLVQGVMESYLGALLADELVGIAGLGYDQASEQYEFVRLRHEVGKAADFDLLQAEVQRDNQRPLIVEAENARSLAYLNLRRLLNLSPRKPLVLADTLLATSGPVPDISGIDPDALAADAEARPAVRTIEETVAAREQAVTVASGARYPEVSLFANYSQQAYPGEVIPEGGDWVDDFAVGFRVNLALFDGFLTSGRVSEAKAQLKVDEQRLAILREERRLAVEQRTGELERARADLLSRQQTVQFAGRVHALSRLRFEEGAANLFDVSDARISEQVARINEARARYDMLVALARLEKLTGRPYLTSLVAGQFSPPGEER
jgi:outer membrane protein TolC